MTSSNDKRNTLLQLNINPITCGDHMAVRFDLLTSLSMSDISHTNIKSIHMILLSPLHP